MQKVRNEHRLLDTLITELRARNDAHLAVKLGWPQAYVSRYCVELIPAHLGICIGFSLASANGDLPSFMRITA